MSLHRRFLKAVLKAGSPRARAARMRDFVDRMKLRPGQRVLDLGGSVTRELCEETGLTEAEIAVGAGILLLSPHAAADRSTSSGSREMRTCRRGV